MATTISMMDVWVYAMTLLKNQQLDINNLQPGLQAGNDILEVMLCAPFRWPWNRGNVSFPITTAGGCDYTQALPTLGFIETQWLSDAQSNIMELKGRVSLAKVSGRRRPIEVAQQYDDGEGNITFRFGSVPDGNYTANFDFQQKPKRLTSPASTFGPVPDQFSHLFMKGVLSEGALIVNDSRFTIWRREWIAQVLATQDGLDEQQKNIFYEQMMGVGRTSYRSQQAGVQGSAGRGI
jgi:hypothetical protein